MKTYRLAMTAFGLSRGDTFSSDDPRWDDYVKAGALIVVEEPAAKEPVVLTVVEEPAAEEPRPRRRARGGAKDDG